MRTKIITSLPLLPVVLSSYLSESSQDLIDNVHTNFLKRTAEAALNMITVGRKNKDQLIFIAKLKKEQEALSPTIALPPAHQTFVSA